MHTWTPLKTHMEPENEWKRWFHMISNFGISVSRADIFRQHSWSQLLVFGGFDGHQPQIYTLIQLRLSEACILLRHDFKCTHCLVPKDNVRRDPGHKKNCIWRRWILEASLQLQHAARPYRGSHLQDEWPTSWAWRATAAGPPPCFRVEEWHGMWYMARDLYNLPCLKLT